MSFLQNRSTLDLKHKERIGLFQRERASLPDRQKQLDETSTRLADLHLLRTEKRLDLAGYAEIKQLEATVKTLSEELEQIRQNKKEYRYMLEVGPIVHKYFDGVHRRNTANSQGTPTRDLNNFFGPKIHATSDKDTLKRADFNELYLAKIDPDYVGKSVEAEKDPSYCYDCKQFKDLDRTQAKLVCQKCGAFENETLDSDKPSYTREQSNDISNFAYKRINHFKEILNQIQATENTDIPQEVYDMILLEMHKERRYNLAELEYKLVKRYLRKYKDRDYNKYYEHINQIICRLTGIKAPRFTQIQEERLLNLFEKIQPAFDKHCPKKRSNFLSYNYILFKFCELLGYDEFLPYFQLLKSSTKTCEQEKIYLKICQEMQFQFIPTV
jgi:hypothetical protein